MAGRYEEREEWVKRIVQTRIICDICGVSNEGDEWGSGEFDVAETEVICRTGEAYPETGNGEQYELDICPKCFKEKLVPWVESHGRGKHEPTRWDY